MQTNKHEISTACSHRQFEKGLERRCPHVITNAKCREFKFSWKRVFRFFCSVRKDYIFIIRMSEWGHTCNSMYMYTSFVCSHSECSIYWFTYFWMFEQVPICFFLSGTPNLYISFFFSQHTVACFSVYLDVRLSDG